MAENILETIAAKRRIYIEEKKKQVESSHAIAQVMKLAPTMRKDQIIICCVSGRGDKDVAAIARYRGIDLYD